MQVFAPAPFRYPAGNGTDYPYGWQDVPQSLADVLIAGKYVTSDGSEARESVNSVVFDSTGAITDPAGLAAVRGVTRRRSVSSGTMRPSANGSSAAGAGYSFILQCQALAPYYGYRLHYANYSTTDITVTLAKAAGCPTDLNDGSALTYITAATSLLVPAGLGGGSSIESVPNIVVTPPIYQASVARTDVPGAAPLLQTRSLFAAACTQGFYETNAPDEIYTLTGMAFATKAYGADIVTSPTAQVPARTGGWLAPIAVEFFYNRPAVTLAAVGDSLTRGLIQVSTYGGHMSLPMRVAILKNATSRTIWSPMSFGQAGQTHTASMNTALNVAVTVQPDYLILRDWSVNNASSDAQRDEEWVRMCNAVDVCLRNGVVPIVLTTGGQTGATAANARIADLNARLKLLAASNNSIILVDAAAIAYDASLQPLQTGADGTHLTDALYQQIAVAVASALPA